MKRELYPYLEKYSIYNPDHIPFNNSFTQIPPSLKKNEKFVFLLSKLQSYQSSTTKPVPSKLLPFTQTSDQWKKILYRTLHSLLTEVTLCKSEQTQNEMLIKIQSWYFNKIHLPSLNPINTNKPLVQSFIYPPEPVQTLLYPVHKKSSSLDPETKIRLTNDYKQSLKELNLSFGTIESRTKILRNLYDDKKYVVSPSLTPEPKVSKLVNKQKQDVVKNYFYSGIGKIQERTEEVDKRNVKTPFGYDKMGQGSLSIVLDKKLPIGGELLMRAPVKPLNHNSLLK